MKFTAATVALAAGAVAQSNIVPGDSMTITTILPITDILSSVYDAMSNANNQALRYMGGDPTTLREAAQDLVEVIGHGIETAEKIEPLTVEDAVVIAPLSQQLSHLGAEFLGNLADDAGVFGAGGYCEHVHHFTALLSEVSNKFFTTTKSKFPAESQEYAQKEINETDAHFAKALAALSPPGCVDRVKIPEQCSSVPVVVEPTSVPVGVEPTGAPIGKPSHSTSVSWHTETSSPGEPTSAPGGNHNGTHPAKPEPTPVTGSASVFAFPGAALALAFGFALMF
ncbi:hypothetical protein E0Z10_g8612 [Xylaria hypoxylon]|uniref:Cell wall protein n=1 Tax=Xylaria hypoxylon TaxID=37992 RepID=A0A4Z0YAV3_9PEZI|nr:hypothetical protein E0Z10_g8612 [Xylaria hypoxylon]